MYLCNFCKKEFSSKSSLNTHIKNARYCINNREDQKEIETSFICKFCNKKYTTKQTLNMHLDKCINSEYYLKNIKLENMLEMKEKQIQELKETFKHQIKELKDQVKELQDRNQELALRAIDKPTSIQTHLKTDNHSVTNTYNHLQPVNLSPDYLYQILDQNIKFEDIYQGQKGLANIVAKKLLTDGNGRPMAFCNDKSRQIIKYKNQDGEIIKDAKAYNLVNSIAPVAERIAMKRKNEFEEKYYTPSKKCEDDETEVEEEEFQEDEESEEEEEFFGFEDSDDEEYKNFLKRIAKVREEKKKSKQKEQVEEIIKSIREKEDWSQEKKNFYFSKLIRGITDYQLLNINPTIFSKQLSIILPSETLKSEGDTPLTIK